MWSMRSDPRYFIIFLYLLYMCMCVIRYPLTLLWFTVKPISEASSNKDQLVNTELSQQSRPRLDVSRDMSVIESLLNLPLRHVSDNVCRFCQKTFCCTKCRDRHVDKVHPDLNVNCSLCASKTLPMRQFEFEKLLGENKKLLSHIADKHLPLRCILCENLIETGENLRSIGNSQSIYIM